MARRLLSGLALAAPLVVSAMQIPQGVQEYITVTHLDITILGLNMHAIDVVLAAATTDAGYSACQTAGYFFTSCAVNAPIESAAQASCLCCYSGQPVIPLYSSCASYIANDAPAATEAFSTISVMYQFCRSHVCDGGGPGPGPKPTPPPTPPSQPNPPPPTPPRPTPPQQPPPQDTTAAPVAPAGCTSLFGIISSCSSELPNFTKMTDAELANCICYDNASKYNTVFDDYADQCAPFAKTQVPEEYTIISGWGTFCEGYPPQTDEPSRGGFTASTRRPTTTTGGGRGPGVLGTGISMPSELSATDGATAGQQSTSSTTTVTVRPSSALAPGTNHPGVPGLVVFMANALTLVLSFFALM